MTKERFRAAVGQLVDELTSSMPDELWEEFYSIAKMHFGNGETVVVGIEEAEPGE